MHLPSCMSVTNPIRAISPRRNSALYGIGVVATCLPPKEKTGVRFLDPVLFRHKGKFDD
jgi:hypothetical protein